MLIFAYPWLWVLIPLPWLLRMMLPKRRHALAVVRVPFGDRIHRAVAANSVSHRARHKWGTQLVSTFIWLLIITALTRPQWLEPPLTRDMPTRDLLLLVDLSVSMQQEDFANPAGDKVDRLTAVKAVLGEFLLRRDGDRIGLIVFGDAPYLQAPLSTDLNLSRQLLDETAIGMAGPRTAFGDAIGLGLSLFEQSDAPAKTIIALTDGNDTSSQIPAIEAARLAKLRDIRIHTVAIGDPMTLGEDKLDEAALRRVAETTGGTYFFAADRQHLAGIYAELDEIETREVSVITHQPRRDLFYWPLLTALLLSLTEKAIAILKHNRTLKSAQQVSKVKVDPVTGKLTIRKS